LLCNPLVIQHECEWWTKSWVALPRVHQGLQCRYDAFLPNLEKVRISRDGLEELQWDSPIRVGGNSRLNKGKHHFAKCGQGILRIICDLSFIPFHSGRLTKCSAALPTTYSMLISLPKEISSPTFINLTKDIDKVNAEFSVVPLHRCSRIIGGYSIWGKSLNGFRDKVLFNGEDGVQEHTQFLEREFQFRRRYQLRRVMSPSASFRILRRHPRQLPRRLDLHSIWVCLRELSTVKPRKYACFRLEVQRKPSGCVCTGRG